MISSYFDRMFNAEFREKDQKEVVIKEIDSDVFEVFLHCIYPCGCDPARIPGKTSRPNINCYL